jgi:hypothetical protein
MKTSHRVATLDSPMRSPVPSTSRAPASSLQSHGLELGPDPPPNSADDSSLPGAPGLLMGPVSETLSLICKKVTLPALLSSFYASSQPSLPYWRRMTPFFVFSGIQPKHQVPRRAPTIPQTLQRAWSVPVKTTPSADLFGPSWGLLGNVTGLE